MRSLSVGVMLFTLLIALYCLAGLDWSSILDSGMRHAQILPASVQLEDERGSGPFPEGNGVAGSAPMAERGDFPARSTPTPTRPTEPRTTSAEPGAQRTPADRLELRNLPENQFRFNAGRGVSIAGQRPGTGQEAPPSRVESPEGGDILQHRGEIRPDDFSSGRMGSVEAGSGGAGGESTRPDSYAERGSATRVRQVPERDFRNAGGERQKGQTGRAGNEPRSTGVSPSTLLLVKFTFSLILGSAALFVILSKRYDRDTKRWAFSILTTITGVWIGTVSS